MIWLAGGQPDMLAQAPGDRARYVANGTMLMTTAIVAVVSATVALQMAMHLPVYAALPFGVGWGLVILTVDRMLVLSMVRRFGFRQPRNGENSANSLVWRTFGSGLLAALVLVGCDAGSDAGNRTLEPHPAPSTGLKCNDMTGLRAFIRPLPAGVSVDPDEQSVPRSETPTGNGVLPFRVHVDRGATGILRAQLVEDDPTRPYTMADMVGPRIVTDADGWQFTRSRND